ncbi:MAG: aldo/keto reductase [Bacteroidota bacterium]
MTETRLLPELVLGTAMWGWNVSTQEAHHILDVFYENGFRQVDAATNYPINKNPDDFRRSEQILEAWIRANGIKDLEIMMKIGSINNLYTPDHNLTPSFLQLNWQYYQGHFETNLAAMMIHWDNRDEIDSIKESFTVLDRIHRAGLKIGASGVRYPEVYAAINQEFQLPLIIQLKHNLLYSDIPRYASLDNWASYYSYGINAGGLKLSSELYTGKSTLKARGRHNSEPLPLVQDLKPTIKAFNQKKKAPSIAKMNEVSMCFALLNTRLSGVLLGPSRVAQLQDSLHFYQGLKSYDYSDLFKNLINLHRGHAPADRSI